MKLHFLSRALPVLVIGLACFSAQAAQAAINPAGEVRVRQLAQSIYGDAECASVLFTANPYLLTLTDVTKMDMPKLVKPKNSACVVLASYIRPQNTNLVSHEIVESGTGTIAYPEDFVFDHLASIQKEHGDVVDQRYDKMYLSKMDLRQVGTFSIEALFYALYGQEKGQSLIRSFTYAPSMEGEFTYYPMISSTSTWFARAASVVGNVPAEQLPKMAYRAVETEDGKTWSFEIDGTTYVNGKSISDVSMIGDRFVLHPVSGHWMFMVTSTIYTDQTSYYIGEGTLDVAPWLLKDGSVMYVVRRGEGNEAKYDLYKNAKIVGTYDWIDEIAYVNNTEDVAYRVRVGDAWHIVNVGVAQPAWNYAGELAVDPQSDIVAYRARSADGAWHMVFGNASPALSWEPEVVYMNPATKTPIAMDSAGHVWTPNKEWKLVSRPYIFDVSDSGRLLIQALDYPFVAVTELWVDSSSLGVYGQPSFESVPKFEDAKASEVYHPGFVSTYIYSMTFDAQNRLVVYRQEGRVFTRSVYEVK